MAWSIPTYDGVAAHGRPSNLRVAMFELIRGIDERLVAIGGTIPNYWWVSQSPHQKQNPTFDELEFLRCTGNKTGGTTANANKAYRNMALITDRIESMLNTGRWRTASGGSTAYTVSSMEAAIGTTLEYPTSITEARWWQSIQDALDLMIHARSVCFAVQTGEISDTRTNPSLEAAWDALSPIPNVSGSLPPQVEWGMSFVPFGSVYRARATIQSSGYFSLQGSGHPYPAAILLGDFVSGEYEYDKRGDSTFAGDPIDVELDGNTITFGIDPAFEPPEYVPSSSLTLGVEIPFSFEISTPLPPDSPFDGLGQIFLSLSGLIVYHDIASALTDQA